MHNPYGAGFGRGTQWARARLDINSNLEFRRLKRVESDLSDYSLMRTELPWASGCDPDIRNEYKDTLYAEDAPFHFKRKLPHKDRSRVVA